MTCSRSQRTATRPGLEPGTPWSIVRDANHCASLPTTPTPICCGLQLESPHPNNTRKSVIDNVEINIACVRGFPMVPMVYRYRLRFYQLVPLVILFVPMVMPIVPLALPMVKLVPLVSQRYHWYANGTIGYQWYHW